MAAGDVVFQLNNAPVISDDSERGPSFVTQVTEFSSGTFVVPSGGEISFSEPLRVAVARSASGPSTTETLFDASKLYKITIEEA